MENYRRKFKLKHSFTDEECDLYKDDDIMIDIIADLPSDALEQWNEYKEEHGYISLLNWTGVKHNYVPRNVDNSGMDELRKDFDLMYKQIENSLNVGFGIFEYNKEDVNLDDSDIDE